MSRTCLLLLAALAMPLSGCASGPEADSVEFDATQVTSISAELGGSYDLSVLRAESTVALTNDHLKLLRFEVGAGETFAAVMRQRVDETMDPYLALYGPDETTKTVTSEYDQSLIPMGFVDDAVVMFQSAHAEPERFSLLAGDLHIDAEAEFQIDLLAIDAELPDATLTLSNPGLRALMGELRKEEPRVAYFVSLGGMSEGADGYLEFHAKSIEALKERAEANGLTRHVNSTRAYLFREIARANDHEGDLAFEKAIGSFCSALWRELRTDKHALR
jgi:hypothetical protein